MKLKKTKIKEEIAKYLKSERARETLASLELISSYDTLFEILEDLKNFNDDTIIALNYDNGMGYSFDYWEESDKVDE